jgi:hypothetical protein
LDLNVPSQRHFASNRSRLAVSFCLGKSLA